MFHGFVGRQSELVPPHAAPLEKSHTSPLRSLVEAHLCSGRSRSLRRSWDRSNRGGQSQNVLRRT